VTIFRVAIEIRHEDGRSAGVATARVDASEQRLRVIDTDVPAGMRQAAAGWHDLARVRERLAALALPARQRPHALSWPTFDRRRSQRA
jgi:hypothetical protein